LNELLKVDHKKYSAELEKVKQYHKTFGPKFPKELSKELDDLAARLKSS
jgi:GTP-dependent phosphoenolpyruvate carboxykinase